MIAVDTSVVVAGLMSWHEFHRRALQALEKALQSGTLIVPLPVLVESYSVMTRLPSPYRLRPEVALELLRDSFSEPRVVALAPRRAWSFLHECVTLDASGGRVYDALIASTALDAHARELLTFNPRDFDAFSDRITIVVP